MILKVLEKSTCKSQKTRFHSLVNTRSYFCSLFFEVQRSTKTQREKSKAKHLFIKSDWIISAIKKTVHSNYVLRRQWYE